MHVQGSDSFQPTSTRTCCREVIRQVVPVRKPRTKEPAAAKDREGDETARRQKVAVKKERTAARKRGRAERGRARQEEEEEALAAEAEAEPIPVVVPRAERSRRGTLKRR